MAEQFKICPICDTAARGNAMVCKNCGGSLANVQALQVVKKRSASDPQNYDYHYGETDLYEGGLRSAAQRYLMGMIVFTLTLLLVGGMVLLWPSLSNIAPNLAAMLTPPTFTPRPTMVFATVTAAPPTLTPSATALPTETALPTATPEPCLRTVQAGDTLISLILSCGYPDREIMEQVMEDNGISNAALIRVGQTIVIPWPTPTPDPAAPNTGAFNADGTTIDVALMSDGAAVATDPFSLAIITTPTLPAGVAWHTVQAGENMLSIAFSYNTTIGVMCPRPRPRPPCRPP
jgi:hypothetical protein